MFAYYWFSINSELFPRRLSIFHPSPSALVNRRDFGKTDLKSGSSYNLFVVHLYIIKIALVENSLQIIGRYTENALVRFKISRCVECVYNFMMLDVDKAVNGSSCASVLYTDEHVSGNQKVEREG